MPRTTYSPARPGFIVDLQSVDRSNGGRQIDWANVSSAYLDSATGKKRIPAGTVMGDLLGSGKISPRVVTTNPAIGLLETDAVESDPAAPLSGYGLIVGGVIYEALLPDASGSPRTLASAIKTELNTAGASKGFLFQKYEDAR